MKTRKNEIWASYQKEIADDHYFFARSCIRQNFFPAAENLYLNILRNDLGKDIYDDARQTTCTGIAYHSGVKRSTGKIFEIPKNLVHASDVIYKFRKEISAKAKFRLLNQNTREPLKVIDHIGCHYAKIFPQKGIDGAEYPYVLAGLIDDWGGKQIDYPERRHC